MAGAGRPRGKRAQNKDRDVREGQVRRSSRSILRKLFFIGRFLQRKVTQSNWHNWKCHYGCDVRHGWEESGCRRPLRGQQPEPVIEVEMEGHSMMVWPRVAESEVSKLRLRFRFKSPKSLCM